MRIEKEVSIPMRDGVNLKANLYFPDKEGVYPAVLCRLPYNKNDRFGKPHDVMQPMAFVEAGFCVVMQDQRGTGTSEGLLTSTGFSEFNDGYDTIDWIAKQSWCNGHVGVFGTSNHGFASLAAASTLHPALMAVAPWQCQSWAPFNMNWGGTITVVNKLNWVYNQSARQLENMNITESEREEIQSELDKYKDHLPEQLKYKPLYKTPAANVKGFGLVHEYVDTVCKASDYAYWQSIGRPVDYSRMDYPMLHLSGWCDFLKDSTINNYMTASASGGTKYMRKNQYLIMGPWNHGSVLRCSVGNFDFGVENRGDELGMDDKLANWFKHFMEDVPLDEYFAHKVHYFIMQSKEWRTAEQWPDPSAVDKILYLDSDGHANTLHGDGRLSFEPGSGTTDTFITDPERPIPTKPDAFRLKRLEDSPEIQDFTEIELRDDVLVYTSETLENAVNVAGTVRIVLYAATDAGDTDFMCRLLDVDPSGAVYNVTEGAVRARFRESFNPDAVRANKTIEEKFVTPGVIEKYDVYVGNCAWCFKAGHKLRIEVAGSSFPRHDINPGVAAPLGYAEKSVIQTQTIYHDAEHQSVVILPIVK